MNNNGDGANNADGTQGLVMGLKPMVMGPGSRLRGWVGRTADGYHL